MKKTFVVLGPTVLAIMLLSSCSSFSGITSTEKPGFYYVTVNTSQLFGNKPRVLLCESVAPDQRSLDCKEVTWKREN